MKRLLISAGLLAGCLTPQTHSGSVTLDDFLDRHHAVASAELNCPQPTVTVKLVHEGSSPVGPGVDGGEVLVTGCAQQVTYFNRDGTWGR